MDHIAIMNKKLGDITQILNGDKRIESRWYLSRKAPWDKIQKGDTVYFKNSSDPVTVKALAIKVLQFSDLTTQKVREILKTYQSELSVTNLQQAYNQNKHKKFCILVFLSKPQKISPFNIDKTGFGISSAWLCTPKISQIKKH